MSVCKYHQTFPCMQCSDENAALKAELEKMKREIAKVIAEMVLDCEKEKALSAKLAEESRMYHELLYAVARKFEGETRHQTALKYIGDAEKRAEDCGGESNESERGGSK